MGTDIHGWVEINTISESMQDLWFKAIDISVIGWRNYAIFSYLFGVRSSEDETALASNRGLPPLGSSQAEINPHYYDELLGEYLHNQSWISYQELAPHLNELPLGKHDWGWAFIFESMGKLAVHYGDQHVRIVVAFDN